MNQIVQPWWIRFKTSFFSKLVFGLLLGSIVDPLQAVLIDWKLFGVVDTESSRTVASPGFGDSDFKDGDTFILSARFDTRSTVLTGVGGFNSAHPVHSQFSFSTSGGVSIEYSGSIVGATVYRSRFSLNTIFIVSFPLDGLQLLSGEIGNSSLLEMGLSGALPHTASRFDEPPSLDELLLAAVPEFVSLSFLDVSLPEPPFVDGMSFDVTSYYVKEVPDSGRTLCFLRVVRSD